MGSAVTVTLTAEGLQRERANLERGSLVAEVAGLAVGSFCEVELRLPSGEQGTFPARVVLVTPAGTVFAFDRLDRELLLRAFEAAAAPVAEAPDPGGAADGDAAEGGGDAVEEAEGVGRGATVEERLRGLPVAEQLRVAREGSLAERVALERIYGKGVWEAILRNAHVSAPEVARIAKMGSLPRPLLELISSNAAWLQIPQVRRALLTNPRLPQEVMQRILGMMPRAELKLVPQAAIYPPAVRAAAKAMVRT